MVQNDVKVSVLVGAAGAADLDLLGAARGEEEDRDGVEPLVACLAT